MSAYPGLPRFNMRRLLSLLACSALALAFTRLSATEAPAAPESALSRLTAKLAKTKPAPATAALTKEQLLRAEFRFKRSAEWVMLPELAKTLAPDEAERAAVLQLLEAGTQEARKLLAAEGAENDVVAATALFMTQLWQVARDKELPEAHVDALHEQIVRVYSEAKSLEEIGRMPDRDKQRYWEFCVGFPVFVLGMKEVVTEASALADLRAVASAGFNSLVGVKPELVDIGAQGLVVRAGLQEAMEKQAQPTPQKSAPGVSYTEPSGWTKEEAGWATIYRATLTDVGRDGKPVANPESQHAASIFVLPTRPAPGGGGKHFDAVWREQFGSFVLGDTVAHYRSRLKSGLVIHYMGRFFPRPNQEQNALDTYGVLYLVDLGDRVQPITATVVPGRKQFGMATYMQDDAMQALAWQLFGFLDSIKPSEGTAPHPSGGVFSPSDIHGKWNSSSSAFGGFYVNSVTGASAGAAIHSSGGYFHILPDGTYSYSLAYYSQNPVIGNSSGYTKHQGTYTLNGDVFLGHPSKEIGYKFTNCTVGVGLRQTPEGPRRILITVGANNAGIYRSPPLVPCWDSYEGTMNWYQEAP